MRVRAANPADAPAIAEIYSGGIMERVATFETQPKEASDVLAWFETGLPIVVAEIDGVVAGFAAAYAYSNRPGYAGVAEFSVYVLPEYRSAGAGRAAVEGLIDALKDAGFHKLLARVFAENTRSLGLLQSMGFREVGIHYRHGQLDGRWLDVVVVELSLVEDQ